MTISAPLKILVLGQGGREHAILHALGQSPSKPILHAMPGSEGMRPIATCHSGLLKNFSEVLAVCKRNSVDLVIVGPEEPAVLGLTDFLRAQGLAVFGPSQKGAMLEGSKIFAKQFMQKAHIPTSEFVILKNTKETLLAAKSFQAPYVLKADGLAAGKGVFICETMQDLEIAARQIFEEKIFGAAGAQAMLEAHIQGWEMSFLFLTDGKSFQSLPVAQDHKRLHEKDLGPNTGGMGTIAPLEVAPELRQKIESRIIEPTLQALQSEGIIFRGVVFLGLMIKDGDPYLLEYNCRFGDPETQVILPLIESDLVEVFASIAAGTIPEIKVHSARHACCVVMAAGGYPTHPRKGDSIRGNLDSGSADQYFLHAGTAKNLKEQWVTSGGRVLCAMGIGQTRSDAIAKAYAVASTVQWPGMHLRKDIGKSQN